MIFVRIGCAGPSEKLFYFSMYRVLSGQSGSFRPRCEVNLVGPQS